MRRLLFAVTAFAASSAAGCGDELPHHARAAEEVRELELLVDVPVRQLTREEFAAEAEDNAGEISEEFLQYYADTYGRLGFFDRSIDLRPVFAGSSSDWVGATYSPSQKRITLVGDYRDDTAVHEWVHALQDQHFDIAAYDLPETSDSFLARRAIVEGDATLAQYRYVALYEYDVDVDGLDWEAALASRRDFSLETLVEADYPPVFLDYVSFVYTYGLEYAAHNLTGLTYEEPEPAPAPHDWGLADEMFTSRPADTTQAILGLGDADPVVDDIGLQQVPVELEDRFETVDWDRLGEWYTYLLLFPLDLDGRALAAAWDGDRALFVRDLETDAVATIWASVWDDEAAAAAIEAALWQLYGRTPIEGQPETIATGDDGELVWIERRGNRVVAVRNLDPEAGAPLVEAAFAGPVSEAPKRHLSLPAAIEIERRLRDGERCPIVSKNAEFPL